MVPGIIDLKNMQQVKKVESALKSAKNLILVTDIHQQANAKPEDITI